MSENLPSRDDHGKFKRCVVLFQMFTISCYVLLSETILANKSKSHDGPKNVKWMPGNSRVSVADKEKNNYCL